MNDHWPICCVGAWWNDQPSIARTSQQAVAQTALEKNKEYGLNRRPDDGALLLGVFTNRAYVRSLVDVVPRLCSSPLVLRRASGISRMRMPYNASFGGLLVVSLRHAFQRGTNVCRLDPFSEAFVGTHADRTLCNHNIRYKGILGANILDDSDRPFLA